METASCTVRLGGDLRNTVFKENVTPAEVVLLKAIHGEEAIVDVELTGSDKRPHGDERDRLQQRYGGAKNGDDRTIFSLIFPSPLTPLPVRFSEIGIEIEGGAKRRQRREAPPAPPEGEPEQSEDPENPNA